VLQAFIDPMQGHITLTLLDLRFFAYHGWYEQEALQGQTFLVNLWVTHPEPVNSIQSLDQALDYTQLFGILSDQMKRPRKLLEDLAQSILTEMHERFPQTTSIRIHIEKTSPPVTGLDGRLGIQLERTF
jgi:dihydroneopterin aldolase